MHHRRGDRHALELAARERVGTAVEQVRHAQAEGGLLHGPRHRAGGGAAMLKRQLELGPDAAHDDLGLRLLEDRAAHRGELARAMHSHVQAADAQLARRLAAMEMRHESDSAQRVDFPDPETPASTVNVPGSILSEMSRSEARRASG